MKKVIIVYSYNIYEFYWHGWLNPFLAHGWHGHAMRCLCSLMALDHSLFFINFFVKLGLNFFPVPPLLSIVLVPRVFCPQRLEVLGGGKKAQIFAW